MKKLNSKEKALYKRIARILWKDWDPIGVYNREDEWDDEYDSYVPHIYRLAVEGKDAFNIASNLSSMAQQNMRYGPSKEHDEKVAKLIIKAREEIYD